jgi:hypothetical protein
MVFHKILGWSLDIGISKRLKSGVKQPNQKGIENPLLSEF